jgi:hypothetical protein
MTKIFKLMLLGALALTACTEDMLNEQFPIAGDETQSVT